MRHRAVHPSRGVVDRVLRVLEVSPDVRSGELEIVELRMLGPDRQIPLFDILAGSASRLFPSSSPLDQHIVAPTDPTSPERGVPLGDQLLLSFKNNSTTEDLYVAGFRLVYELDGEHHTLDVPRHAFVSCVPTTPVDQCGAGETTEFVAGN